MRLTASRSRARIGWLRQRWLRLPARSLSCKSSTQEARTIEVNLTATAASDAFAEHRTGPTASVLPALVEELCAGAEYDADLETNDGSLAAGQPPVFHTASLLGSPGAVISVRVYAVTGDDLENDSQALSVQRPAA